MSTELNQNEASSVKMQVTDDVLESIEVNEEGLSKEAEEMLKQTAMRTILFQISMNYKEELETLLGKDNVDESGQPIALQESSIPYELYEFICKNIIGMVPDIEIEIIEEGDPSEIIIEVEEDSEESQTEDSEDSFEEE